MNNLKKYKIVLFLFLLIGTFTSCYKKDLEEFKKVVFELKSDVAFPIFNATITIEDSAAYVPNMNISDSVFLTNDQIGLSDSLFSILEAYNVKDIQFKVYIKNSFPVNGSLQVYFLNDNNKIVDSLFSIHKYAVKNPDNGYESVSEVYIDINEKKYEEIANSKNVKIVYSYMKNNFIDEKYKLFIGCGVILKP
jgi:hypothetical protein